MRKNRIESKLIALVLMFSMLLSFTACGDSSSNYDDEYSYSTEAPQETQESKATEELKPEDLKEKYNLDEYVKKELEGIRLDCKSYSVEDNIGYLKGDSSKNLKFGANSFSELTIDSKDGMISEGAYNDFKAYKVTGEDVSINLGLKYDIKNINESGWYLDEDEWGVNKEETLLGMDIYEEVGYGKVVIQKSYDGISWENSVLDGISLPNGEIYTLSGSDVKSGVYIRVNYLYETAKAKEREVDRKLLWVIPAGTKIEEYTDVLNQVETYEFYVAFDDVDAVAFNNLSANNDFDGGQNTDYYEYVKFHNLNTLRDGDLTVSGFKLNTQSLPYKVKYSYNGEDYKNAENKQEFTKNGRYDIIVKTQFGEKKELTLYVDKSSENEVLTKYFGDGFLSKGIRVVYKNSDYPVYIADYTTIQLAGIDKFTAPMVGILENLSTGTKIELESGVNMQEILLEEVGEYRAFFKTNKAAMEGKSKISGDDITVTYKFKLISKEDQETVNKDNLYGENGGYRVLSVADYYSVFYGVVCESAGEGKITLVYKDEDDAIAFAKKYEKSNVNVIENDGVKTYEYCNPFNNGEIISAESADVINDAIAEVVNERVSKMYFDASDSVMIQTILPEGNKDKDILVVEKDEIAVSQDLRQLKLVDDIIVFAKGERDKMIARDHLPYLNNRINYYVDEDGNKNDVSYAIQLIDEMSNSVSIAIADANGTIYGIEYNKSVGDQLAKQSAPSDSYTIYEELLADMELEYNAFYIKEGENTAILNCDVLIDGNLETIEISQKDCSVIECGGFTINSIVDRLDSYSIMQIENKKTRETQIMQISDASGYSFDQGLYNIKMINRLGYTFDFDVAVGTPIIKISFDCNGGSAIDPIAAVVGNVIEILPKSKRYGYELKGYENSAGDLFDGMIFSSYLESNTILTAIWEPVVKKVNFEIEGMEIESLNVKFGTKVDLPIPVDKSGFVFKGWLYGDTLIENGSFELLEDKNVELKAKYEKIYASINFDCQSDMKIPLINCKVGEIVELPKIDMEQYAFVGWLNDGSIVSESLYIETTEDITLEACWQIEEVKICIYSSDGSQLVYERYADYGGIMTLPIIEGYSDATYYDGDNYYWPGQEIDVPDGKIAKFVINYDESIELHESFNENNGL